MKRIEISSIKEMKEFGNKLGKNLKGGECITLTGDLGAGKTHLTKFIGEGMGIDDYITSPTFSILNIYYGDINLNHFDMYRIEDGYEFRDLGFDDYLFSDSDVSVIEWPEIAKDELPESLDLTIEKYDGEKRVIYIDYKDDKYREIVENI